MNSDQFYRHLPEVDDFRQVFLDQAYREVPADWWLVMTDVIGSTKAIEAGLYKEVNAAGGLGVMALANHFGHMDFPFIFGGDGLTCLVPGGQAEAARSLMLGTVARVKQAFGLDLRLALIPVTELYRAGQKLALAKWRVSPRYCQALLEGAGLDWAEKLMKTPGSPWLVTQTEAGGPQPDFSGYTCRWEDYPSRHGETVALIVKFRPGFEADRTEFLHKLDELLGSAAEHHPLHVRQGRMTLRTRRLNAEAAVFTGSPKGWPAFWARQRLRLLILFALVVRAFNLPVKVGKQEVARAPEDNILTADFRKFDNTLKLVAAVSPGQRARLETWLKDLHNSGQIFFGLQVSDRAVITCLLYNHGDGEVHFVDAADGGYAFAAKQLKAQLAEV